MMTSVNSGSSNGDDSPFIPTRPLVPDSKFEFRYSLTEDDIRNDKIEKMYGPFDDATSITPPISRSPSQNAQTAYEKQQKEIEELRKCILEREKMRRAIYDMKLVEISSKRHHEKPITSFISTPSKAIRPSAAQLSAVPNGNGNSNRVSSNNKEEPIVIDSDSDSWMDVDDNEAQTSSSSAELITVPKTYAPSDNTIQLEENSKRSREVSDEMYISEKMGSTMIMDDSDTDAYETAEEDFEEEEAAVLDNDLKIVGKELEELEKTQSEIRLYLLGMQARLSIEKNKRETMIKKKPSIIPAARSSSSKAPRSNPGRGKGWQQKQPKGSKNRYSYNPPHPPPITHQLPMMHQLPVNTNRYSPYFRSQRPARYSSLHPPPPPPNVMPLPPLPPPNVMPSFVPSNIGTAPIFTRYTRPAPSQ